MKKREKERKSLKTIYKEFKANPTKSLNNLRNSLIKTLKENKLFVAFAIINVLNGMLLRMLTLGSSTFFDFDALLADLTFVLFVGSFSYFFREKGKFIYLLCFKRCL